MKKLTRTEDGESSWLAVTMVSATVCTARVRTCRLRHQEKDRQADWTDDSGAGFFLSPLNVQREREDLVLGPGGRSVQEAALLDLVVRVSHQRLDAGHANLPQLGQE